MRAAGCGGTQPAAPLTTGRWQPFTAESCYSSRGFQVPSLSGLHHWSALFRSFQLLALSTARFSTCPSTHPAFRQPLWGDPTSNHVSQPGKSSFIFKAIISYWFCSSREPQPIQILLRHRCVDKHPNIQWLLAKIIYSHGCVGQQEVR